MAAAASHTLGSKVWVNDAVEGWVKGDVVKVEKGSLKVSTEKGSIKAYKPEECPLQNPQTAGGVEVRQHQQLHTPDSAPSMNKQSAKPARHQLAAALAPDSSCMQCSVRGCNDLAKLVGCLRLALLSAGHDHTVLLERARGALEPESTIPAGWHLHIHRLYFNCSQSLCVTPLAVWAAYDGAVQRQAFRRAVPSCLCNS